jgi:hypothetical protein
LAAAADRFDDPPARASGSSRDAAADDVAEVEEDR